MKIRQSLICLAALIFAGNAFAQSAPSLSVADIDRIVGQALAEAAARSAGNGAVAVTDRVGNVLGVYVLDPQNLQLMTVTSGRGISKNNGLEGLNVLPSYLGAIAKALTGAYLSSSGNAFTSRTASQIVQEHFNPGEKNTPSGPLFGVQFSQLPCSDLTRSGPALGPGPHRSPLGLSADPGGLPLYKNGEVVGGVGVIFDGVYGLDLNIEDYDKNLDELIAVAAQQGFTAPTDIDGRITADAKNFRTTDVDRRDLKSSTAAAVNASNYIAVTGYTPAGRRAGLAFGTNASGIRPDNHSEYAGIDAYVLDDGTGANRYLPRASYAPSVAGGGLAAAEVRTIIAEALKVAFKSRAQIRRPLGSYVQVTVAVVDAESNILALARTPDAPVFGTDVSLQKARSVLFASRPTAAAELRAIPAATILQDTTVTPAQTLLSTPALSTYVDAFQTLVSPNALADGKAFSDRAIGLLARPFYPDGLEANANGPLSKPFTVWSPFNDGLQLDLVLSNLGVHLLGVVGAPGGDEIAPLQGCTALPSSAAAGPGPTPTRLANGLQIFPGAVPIYRNGALIGAVGVSGDGVDQDDMVSFLGLHNAGQILASGVGNAPKDKRADKLKVGKINLRYVQCPFTPFNNSTEQNVCSGK